MRLFYSRPLGTLAASLGLIMLSTAAPPALASSHREAPSIAGMPKVDGTDFYLFNSYDLPAP